MNRVPTTRADDGSTSSFTTGWVTRRNFLKAVAAGGIAATGGWALLKYFPKKESRAETFIASINGYRADLSHFILRGMTELGVSSVEITGKRILLKPNLVEPHSGKLHINTHPLIVEAAAEAFLNLGAAEVKVAEGAGHRRDSLLVLEESGLADVLYENKIPFIDLNTGPVVKVGNSSNISALGDLFLPREVAHADFLVSLAKMKTHHWRA